MTQFIKITVISGNFADRKYRILFINAKYIQRVEPAVVGSTSLTRIIVSDYHSNSGNEAFYIQETPEEILAQLK